MRRNQSVVVTFVAAAVGLFGFRVSGSAAPAIHLRARTIQPGSDAASDRALMVRAVEEAGRHGPGGLRVLVQLDAVPDRTRRNELARHGLVLAGYVPENAFVAQLRPGADVSTLSALGVTWLGVLSADDKVAGALAPGRLPPVPARLGGGQAAVVVEFHGDITLADGAVQVAAAGAEVRGEIRHLNALIVAVSPQDVARLAALAAVKWIEPVSPGFRDLNDEVRRVLHADSVQAPPFGLDGSGVEVLVYDGGMVCPTQPDLSPRVTVGEDGLQATHATHVAGTLAGRGAASSGLYRGVAPGAGIISYAYESCSPICLYNNPQDLADNYGEAILLHGADLASNSIGANVAANGYDCDYLGDYENTARLIDAIAAGALGRPFLSFWAAGNERSGEALCGADFYTIGVPAAAKNAIVVGAIDSDTGEVSSFSSLGPVDDGRMRPDLVAPGCQRGGDRGITSTRSCSGYTVYCGTSMATPAAAGVAALVLERMRSSERGVITLPAAMKALLACSAEDLGNPGPDYTYGYGLVDASAAVALVDGGLILEDAIDHGGLAVRSFDVPPGQAPLRAVLAWDDPPGEPLALSALVNDLDLRLVDPDGQVHRPFVLDRLFPAAPAERGINRRDPSEMVEVTDPLPGRWRLEVEGHLVPSGPQTFAAVVNAPDAGPIAVAQTSPRPAPPLALLDQNRPNPFNPRTTIRFTVAGSAPVPVTLTIVDLHGRRIRRLIDDQLVSGDHEVVWDGQDEGGRQVASGVYVYEMDQGGRREARRMVLVR